MKHLKLFEHIKNKTDPYNEEEWGEYDWVRSKFINYQEIRKAEQKLNRLKRIRDVFDNEFSRLLTDCQEASDELNCKYTIERTSGSFPERDRFTIVFNGVDPNSPNYNKVFGKLVDKIRNNYTTMQVGGRQYYEHFSFRNGTFIFIVSK